MMTSSMGVTVMTFSQPEPLYVDERVVSPSFDALYANLLLGHCSCWLYRSA